MGETSQSSQALVLFRLAEQRFAQQLVAVERIVRAVAVTPVPEMPAFLLGLVNLGGQLLPVISLRRCLGLPDRPIRPEDQFVIARAATYVAQRTDARFSHGMCPDCVKEYCLGIELPSW